MNKKVVKIASILLIVVMTIMVSVTSFAVVQPNQIKAPDSVTGSDEIVNVGNTMVGILQTVGIILSVVMLIILGIKYMMGSAEEKAEYKKTMIPYVVGAALIFAASALAQVVYQFFIGVSTGS